MAGDGVPTPKKWWKSRTVWFNVLGAVATLQPLLPIDPALLAKVLLVGNVVLRFDTKDSVSVK